MVPAGLLKLPGTAVAPRSPLGLGEIQYLLPLDLFVFGNNHLGDPLAVVDRKGFIAQIDQ